MLLLNSIIMALLPVAQTYDTLHPVRVVADRGVVVSREDTVYVRGSGSVCESLQRLPSFHIGDYGGPSGLKSLSLRGMGSSNTAVYLDGVRVGNLQSGQNDLGMFDVNAFGSVIVDYAQNSVSFNTSRPEFGDSPVSGTVRFRGGSFGLLQPSARVDARLSPSVSMSVTGTALSYRGDFPYGDGQMRTNNDLKQLKTGVDLFGVCGRSNWHAKAYYHGSDRGAPGSADWPSDDRQKDRNALIQSTFHTDFSRLYSMSVSAKASHDRMLYDSSWGDGRYYQTEFQLNTAHKFHINDLVGLSASTAAQWDGMSSNYYDASRLGVAGTCTFSLNGRKIHADASLEYSGRFDAGRASWNNLSPSIDVRCRIVGALELVAFARRAYRVPTFNELYYAGFGNPDLSPEDAWMGDAGLQWEGSPCSRLKLTARLDAFHYYIKDKIVSSPSAEDPNVWLPYNIGRVSTPGIEAMLRTDCKFGDFTADAEFRYSYQSASDITGEVPAFVPYVPRHNAVLCAHAEWKGFDLDACWHILAGYCDSYGQVPDWNTFDLKLGKRFRLSGWGSLKVGIVADNIFDSAYSIVTGYPMPGRSLSGCVEFKF